MSKSKVNLYKMEDSPRQEEKIAAALELLGLEGMRSSFPELSKRFILNNQSPSDFMVELLEKEINWKEESRKNRWIKAAKFPWQKTLKDFDFSYQPSINERQIYELGSCRFINEGENIIFFGQAGVGKTHLSIALGLEAINKGFDVKFFTLENIVELIEKYGDGIKLDNFISNLRTAKVLIIDEMERFEVSLTASKQLSRLITSRYQEHKPTIFTSNKSFEGWSNIFGDTSTANKVIDRINHRSVIINIQGESYRVKDKLEILKEAAQAVI